MATAGNLEAPVPAFVHQNPKSLPISPRIDQTAIVSTLAYPAKVGGCPASQQMGQRLREYLQAYPMLNLCSDVRILVL